MKFSFPYLQVGNAPSRPIIPVRIIGPSADGYPDGLLDTGADRTVLPPEVGHRLGIDAQRLPRRITVSAASGGTIECGLVELVLEIRRRGQRVAWRAEVGIAVNQIRRAHWGHKGFLEFFNANFLGPPRVVTLTTTPKLPRVRLL